MKTILESIARRYVWLSFAVVATGCGPADAPSSVVEGVAFGAAGYDEVGTEQSPIDIVVDDAIVVDDDELPELRFRYGRNVTLEVVNTGSPDEFASIRSNVPKGAARLRIGRTRYNLLQFHWHAPGEHELDGQRFPLELHLVHQKKGATGLDGLAVVGIWFVVDDETNDAIAPIFDELPAEEGESRMLRRFDLRALLPDDLESFRYAGSLTTPPFSEGVRWIVLNERMSVSAEQLAAFVALFPEGNTREVQPLNERVVLTDMGEDDEDDGRDEG